MVGDLLLTVKACLCRLERFEETQCQQQVRRRNGSPVSEGDVVIKNRKKMSEGIVKSSDSKLRYTFLERFALYTFYDFVVFLMYLI